MSEQLNCFHCGLPADNDFDLELKGQNRSFCCIGCQAVAQAIAENGLDNFYQFRDSQSIKPDQTKKDFTIYDQEEIFQDFVQFGQAQDLGLQELGPNETSTSASDQWAIAKLHIRGITCAACVWLLETYLQRYTGIERVSVNASSHQARIVFNFSLIKPSAIFKAIGELGFQAQPLLAQQQRELWKRERKEDVIRLGIAGIGMMQAGMTSVALHAGDMQGIDLQWQNLLRWVSLILATPVILYSAQPFYRAAWRALKTRHLVMDVPVSLALLLAFFASIFATFSGRGEVYFDSVSMFTFFLLLGRFLETGTRLKNLQANADRAQLLPLAVTLIEQEQTRSIPIKQLAVGQNVLVLPGEVIPCDGQVRVGQSEADESLVTGESEAIQKGPGDSVIAGSYNGSTRLIVKVTAVGENTQFAAVEQLVSRAELQKPKIQRFADQVASRFVALVLLTALLVFTSWWFIDSERALWVTLSVLVVTCPCALSLATPAALTAALNRLRRAGVLVTADHVLESLPHIQRVIFDKTGTLTKGRLELSQIQLLGELSEQAVMQLCAALEAQSHHPIARAFAGIEHRFIVQDRSTVLGQGVRAIIDNQSYSLGHPQLVKGLEQLKFPGDGLWLLLAKGQEPLAWIKLEDSLRDDAFDCVDQLREQGKRLAILSGDRLANVAILAAQLKIAEYFGALLPQDKLHKVQSLQQSAEKLVMVGDGINDLPVLAAADVSIAMGSASDLAQSRADVVLVNDELQNLPLLFNLAQKCQAVVRQNLFWALFYNLLALPAAIMGFIPPWLAAIGMSSSSLIVVLNSLRLNK